MFANLILNCLLYQTEKHVKDDFSVRIIFIIFSIFCSLSVTLSRPWNNGLFVSQTSSAIFVELHNWTGFGSRELCPFAGISEASKKNRQEKQRTHLLIRFLHLFTE